MVAVLFSLRFNGQEVHSDRHGPKKLQIKEGCDWLNSSAVAIFRRPLLLKYIHRGLMQLKSTCGPSAMLSRSTIKRAKYYASNWFNCLIVCPLGKVRQV